LIVSNPVVVVEVLSPSTAHHDTSAKLIGYFKLPSLHHYLVADPETRSVTHYTRDAMPNVLTEGDLRLDPPGLIVAIADFSAWHSDYRNSGVTGNSRACSISA
jgi:Uma2 family endonuclease